MRLTRVWMLQRVSCCIAIYLCQVDLLALADDSAQEAFFESKIRPVLVEACYECHSASSKEAKGGLLLDTREGIRRGGDSGSAVAPKDLDESLILDALKYESFEMPPDGPLPESVVADFETWIRLGAYDPRDGKSAPVRREIDMDQARDFWSFQPVAKPAVPTLPNLSRPHQDDRQIQVDDSRDAAWLRDELDAFIAQRQMQQKLQPAADAEGASLVRRIYFDLIGMQPSPREAAKFIEQYELDADAAVADLVDDLLDRPLFGERWGRHWLDVVRYAESTGMERNGTFPHAWRYRDWVIKAFNNDLRYDRFISQQIAGDLLPFGNAAERYDNLIATGLLALGPKSLNEPNAEKFKMDVVDEQIDVVTRAFLGITASCARCHDHKFDPIPQKEYYSLAGIFTSTQTLYGTGKTNGNRRPGGLLLIDGQEVKTIAAVSGKNAANERKQYQNRLKAEKKKLATYEKLAAAAKNDQSKANAEKKICAGQGRDSQVDESLKERGRAE